MSPIEETLLKYFQGNCTEEEKESIESFKQENPEQFNALQKLWTYQGTIKLRSFDKSKAWKQVAVHMQPANSFRRKLLPYLYGAVAAIALLIIFSIFLWSPPTPQSITYKTISGKKGPITLDDGSTVWLNDQATLKYPEVFSEKNRKVMLKGEAYFEVTKNPQKPFIVEAEEVNVKVLGTSFNVKTTHENAKVSVSEGLVEVSKQVGQQKIQVKPGFTATLQGSRLQLRASEDNFQSWRTGRFTFKDTPIQEVIKQLNTYYDSRLSLKDTTANCQLTVSFDQEDIQVVQETISLICDTKIHY